MTTDLKDTRETVTISVTKVKDSLQYEDATTLPSLAEYESAAKEERVQREMSKTTTLFIAVAWMVIPIYRFSPFPEVIWCDVTSHSNNKGFNILIFSCRTSVDKQVVFLWSLGVT